MKPIDTNGNPLSPFIQRVVDELSDDTLTFFGVKTRDIISTKFINFISISLEFLADEEPIPPGEPDNADEAKMKEILEVCSNIAGQELDEDPENKTLLEKLGDYTNE